MQLKWSGHDCDISMHDTFAFSDNVLKFDWSCQCGSESNIMNSQRLPGQIIQWSGSYASTHLVQFNVFLQKKMVRIYIEEK